MKKINIFFSWQSDLPRETNQNLIRTALRNIATEIEEQFQIHINLDEATRDVPGSPNIPQTIFQKIDQTDIFICDLSIINQESTNRKVPNPNVLVELGYAISVSGWNRIIMLFNTYYGELKELPFDIDRHRASSFNSKIGDSKTKADSLKSLETLLKNAISSILKKNPKRPTELRTLTEEELKKARDENTLEEILFELHLPTLEEWIERGPKLMPERILYFWEGFNSIVSSGEFHFYDKTLSNLVKSIHLNLFNCLKHDSEYEISMGGNQYIFTNVGDMPLNADRQEAWNEIRDSLTKLKDNLKDFYTHIRNEYIKIDIKDLKVKSWNKFIENTEEMKKQFNTDLD